MLYKQAAVKLAGIDDAAMKQIAEDWGAAAIETAKEQLPWVVLAVFIMIVGMKWLRGK